MEGHRRRGVNLQMTLGNIHVRRILLDWLVILIPNREGWRMELQRDTRVGRLGLGHCVQAA